VELLREWVDWHCLPDSHYLCQPLVDKFGGPRYPVVMTLRQLSLWKLLRDRVIFATKQRGSQSTLARHLSVSRQALNAWLSGAALPTAENTLQLLKWVEAEEAKQKNSNPGHASTRPGRKTRKRRSTSNEKPKTGQK
jgi:hypothetical protein